MPASFAGLTQTSLLWALFCASAFVVWPTIGKYSGATANWVNVIVLFCTTLVGAALSWSQIRGEQLPSGKAFAMTIIASLINGAAVYAYSHQTVSPQVPTGTFIAVTTVMMVVLGFLVSVVLTDQTMTVRQGIGLCGAVIVIWLLAG